MKIKIYHDKTYNIFFEVGDYVKLKDENIWGKIIKTMGRPITAKLSIQTDNGVVDKFKWDVIPVTEDGTEITKEQLFKITPVTESLFNVTNNDDNNRIIKFNEFN